MSITTLLRKVVRTLVSIIAAFLGLRFVLKLLGASQASSFVDWVYTATDPLLAPFVGIFPTPVTETGFILEFSALIAIIIYLLAGWLLIEFISFVGRMQRDKTRNRGGGGDNNSEQI